MPKNKDKSFELMTSIGNAKQAVKETTKPVDKTYNNNETAEQEKGLGTTKVTTSNIPYVPPSLAVKKQLKRLAFEEETSMTALISEGLDYIFKKRGLKSIDQLTDT